MSRMEAPWHYLGLWNIQPWILNDILPVNLSYSYSLSDYLESISMFKSHYTLFLSSSTPLIPELVGTIQEMKHYGWNWEQSFPYIWNKSVLYFVMILTVTDIVIGVGLLYPYVNPLLYLFIMLFFAASLSLSADIPVT